MVELTQKWVAANGLAEKLGEKSQWKIESSITTTTKKHKSRERQIKYLDDYNKLKSKSQVLFTKFYCKNFGGLAEIHGLCVINNPWVTSMQILLTGFQEKDLEAQEKDDLKTFGVSSDLVSAM